MSNARTTRDRFARQRAADRIARRFGDAVVGSPRWREVYDAVKRALYSQHLRDRRALAAAAIEERELHGRTATWDAYHTGAAYLAGLDPKDYSTDRELARAPRRRGG